MTQNDCNVGGNHKYLQISINTDNVKEILRFLYNEVSKQGQDLSSLNTKVTQILSSDKVLQLGNNIEEYNNESNKKFENFNNTINSLLKSFNTHQNSVKTQIEKVNAEIRNDIADKILSIENQISPFSIILNRIKELQILCDQICSDKSIIERFKNLKNMENDIEQLQIRIKKLEESQNNSNKELENTIPIPQANEEVSSARSYSFADESDNNNQEIDNNEIINNTTEKQANENNNINKNNDNPNEKEISSLSKNQTKNINRDNNNNQQTKSKSKNEKSNLISKNDYTPSNNNNNNKYTTNYTKSNSIETHPVHTNSIENDDITIIKNGGPITQNNQKNEPSQAKNDSKPSKKSSTKSNDIADRLNRKSKKEKTESTSTQNKTKPNTNSKTGPLPSQNNLSPSRKEVHKKNIISPRSSPNKNQLQPHHNSSQTDLQKKKEEEDDSEYGIADELRDLKELLSLQAQQLSSLMQPDSFLLSSIAKIVSEMLEKRKNEIDDHNEVKLQHFCGEMRKNINSISSQVELANEKISRCATKSELINVADDLLNTNSIDNLDYQNTSIGATSMCRCLACGRPKPSVSTLSRMAKVNSPLYLDRNLQTLMNFKSLSETTTSLLQNQNTSPGARVKLLISEKKTSMNAIDKIARKMPPLDFNAPT